MITPVDRDDMIMAASAHYSTRGGEDGLAGMILTGAKRPESQMHFRDRLPMLHPNFLLQFAGLQCRTHWYA